MTRYLLISGPPGAGKDTVGAILNQYEGIVVEKFAMPLMVAAESLGFTMDDRSKDMPTGPGGISRRDFQIAFSETFAKPLLGHDIFGKALAFRTVLVDPRPDIVVVTDSGFAEEAEALADVVGHENVRRLHLHRDGHDYSNDSRSDWSGNFDRICMTNDVGIDELPDLVAETLWPWYGWLFGLNAPDPR